MTPSPTFHIEDQLSVDRLTEHASDLASESLLTFLSRQRWFGDKARTADNATVVTTSVQPIGDDFALLLVIDVGFTSGEPVRYFVPLTISKRAPDQTLATVSDVSSMWFVSDAVENSDFRQWLLISLSGTESSQTGSFRWSSAPGANEFIARAQIGPSRVSSAQQSNSSIVYGSEIILKVFRRLSSGLNPEVELGRFLSTATTFRNMPLLLGEWSLSETGQSPISLAVAQSFIPSVGDGWSFVLDSIVSDPRSVDEVAGRLGELTAQMHLALESAHRDPDLVAEKITPEDAEHWQAETTNAIHETSSALAQKANEYSGETRELIDAFLAQSARMVTQTEGFDRLVGRTKTRVHGDYHLGQTLRTADDFVILDFEGEPQRPIEQRRLKTSPFKDVAGMLRSFGYARGAVERQQNDVDRAALVDWERSARRAFIERYVASARSGRARFLPDSNDDIRLAIAAWELDKALYEVTYELNNRPDWLALPLAATLKLT